MIFERNQDFIFEKQSTNTMMNSRWQSTGGGPVMSSDKASQGNSKEMVPDIFFLAL